MSESLVEYLAFQQNLLQEASEALPHQFSKCTYSLGHIRQAVYLCQTCPESRGICSACSIACHTDHEQIELFPKRNFRCDCPTDGITHPCSLHTQLEPVNTGNLYGQNFQALFCRCLRPYDAQTERETMIQCLACEDWFHESCCNLRERPSSREQTSEESGQDQGNDNDDETRSEASSSGLPPPLLGASDYDAFVCGTCVSKNSVLQRYAGSPGCLIITRDSPSSPWKIYPEKSPENEVDTLSQADNNIETQKRRGSPSDSTERNAKRQRVSSLSSSEPCLAPFSSHRSEKIYAGIGDNENPVTLGTGDIFLSEGFRNRWCRCSECLPSLQANGYLLEEEDTYDPPSDPDSGLSLEELGMRALSRLPRDRAIDGIHAFNAMREDLVQFLRPFAQNGKVVSDSDVKDFFESLTEKQRGENR
ncbi:hypothetical protein L218DRAFT_983623 [Marasmius fiardii PR-910]|nr:hypothetical protein L218DRAFT_983623 [Marasmius fiardii PR-910]